jgi:hypothetical protein
MDAIRRVGGILLGYITMAGLVVAFHFTLPRLVGPDRLTPTDAGDPPLLWVLVSLAVSLASAGVGGAVCRVIAGCGKTVAVFAAITFVLGAGMAVQPFVAPPPDGTPQTPVWAAVCLAFVGAIGILVGGKLAGRRRACRVTAS